MLNNIKTIIKQNRFVRGLFFFCKRTFGYRRSEFGHLDKGVILTPPLYIANPRNVFIYGDVQLGPGHISGLNARFIMKKGCAVAGGLRVQTGNHARVIGKFVGEVTEQDKPKGYDQDIIVEEDVWLGANVTLLAGVTIGRGTTVAAGAVVNRSMPPYCVCGGVPAKVLKFYWSIDDIIRHEALLYPDNERYTKEELEDILEKYGTSKG